MGRNEVSNLISQLNLRITAVRVRQLNIWARPKELSIMARSMGVCEHDIIRAMRSVVENQLLRKTFRSFVQQGREGAQTE